mmetsp:Transcript_23035/g.48576  ORF Transcript_23035/g.48576 Transcript_23035/m.48576 type:complete len:276 (+) Transcript_23035:480-1307(+)
MFGVEYNGGGAARPVTLGDLGEEEVDGVGHEFDGRELEDELPLGGGVALLEEEDHGDVVWSGSESLHNRNPTQRLNPPLHLHLHILPPILPLGPNFNLPHELPNGTFPRPLSPLQQIAPRDQFGNGTFPRFFASHQGLDAVLEGSDQFAVFRGDFFVARGALPFFFFGVGLFDQGRVDRPIQVRFEFVEFVGGEDALLAFAQSVDIAEVGGVEVLKSLFDGIDADVASFEIVGEFGDGVAQFAGGAGFGFDDGGWSRRLLILLLLLLLLLLVLCC